MRGSARSRLFVPLLATVLLWACPAMFGLNTMAQAAEVVSELWRSPGWPTPWFPYPVSVSVNPSDGSCWVADYGYETFPWQVGHVDADGNSLSWKAVIEPRSVSSNPTDGSCWVGSAGSGVVHLASDGTTVSSQVGYPTFNDPRSVSVSPNDSSCWVADTNNNQVVHLAPDGTTEWSRTAGFPTFYNPYSVSVNPADGSCWVADTDNGQVVHLAPDGTTELSRASGFYHPYSVSVNPTDSSCWVVDYGTQVVHLAPDGTTELSRAGGFSMANCVSVNATDGSCWVAATGNNQVVHLAAGGSEVSRTGGFRNPWSVSVNPTDGSCWVADTENGQVVHVGILMVPKAVLEVHPNERAPGRTIGAGGASLGGPYWVDPINKLVAGYWWQEYRFAASGVLSVQVCAQNWAATQNGDGDDDNTKVAINGVALADYDGIQNGPPGGWQWIGATEQGQRWTLRFLALGAPGMQSVKIAADQAPVLWWVKVTDLEAGVVAPPP